MIRRFVPVAALLCTSHALAAPPPALSQVLDYTVEQFNLPQAPQGPFKARVSLAGQPVVLQLEPYTVRAPDFQLLVDQGDGVLAPVVPAAPRTWRGFVQGLPGSQVAASLTDGRLSASIALDDGSSWQIEPLSDLAPGEPLDARHVIYREEDVTPSDKFCGGALLPPGFDQDSEPPPPGDGGGIAGSGLRIIELGCDADVEYWQINGSSVQSTMFDIENVINSMSQIYESQFSLTFEVTTIVVRTGSTTSDPYSSSNCGTLLNQVTSTWNTSPENLIRRDVAELFTGRNLSDCLGIAWLNAACGSQPFNLVQSKAGGLSFTLRKALSAHEIGHNFSAQHCCGACFGCSSCRIMCPCIGGCSGIMTSFAGPAVSNILNYTANLGCLQNLPPPLSPPFFDDFPSGSFNLNNWTHLNGVLITSGATNEPSAPNSLNLDAGGSGAYQDNEIRSNFINMSGLNGSGWFLDFFTEHKSVPDGGALLVDYWANNQWWNILTITSDGVDQSSFEEHFVELDGLVPSPFHSEFRLRFKAAVDGSSDDWYVDDVLIGNTPAPASDNCSDAILVGSGTFPFTTIGATTDGVVDGCDNGNFNYVNDIWYLYNPPSHGTVTMSICNDADFDTKLSVYNIPTCPPLAEGIACSDDAPGCGVTSEVVFEGFHNMTYRVRIGSTFEAGSGNLTISFVPAPPVPPNNNCGNATATSEGTVAFTTLGATGDGRLVETCDGGSVSFTNDVWYTYQPSCDGTVTVTVCNDADFDTLLAVYDDANCPASSLVTCSDDASGCGQTSEVQFTGSSAVTYRIRIGSTSGSGSGNLTIVCTPAAPPCPWDLNDDSVVTTSDFLALLSAWGPNPGHPADFDGNGTVGTSDFLELLSHWGPCPTE